MDSKDLKKIIAGVTITALIAGAGLTFSGCSTDKSSNSGKSSCSGCAGNKTEGSKSGCGGGSSCSGK